MKKSKVLAGALISALLLMGSGYAVWTDSLKVTTVAKTGEMDVQLLGAQSKSITMKGNNFPETVSMDARILENQINTYLTASLTKDLSTRNKAVFTLNGIYPSSGCVYAIGFQNNSTIPIKVDSIIIEGIDDDLGNTLLSTAGFRQYKKMNVNNKDVYELVQYSANSKYNNLIKRPYTELFKISTCPINNLQEYLNNMFENVTMNPEDIISLQIPIVLPSTVDNNDLQGKTCSFTMAVNFKQFNE